MVLLICFPINDNFALLPVVILIILLQLWSLKSDYQILENLINDTADRVSVSEKLMCKESNES